MRARPRLVTTHVVLALTSIGICALALIAVDRSRTATASAERVARDAATAQRVGAELRSLLGATWRFVLSGTPSELARAKEAEAAVDRLRAPLAVRLELAELVDAIDATLAASTWATDQRLVPADRAELPAQLSRVAAELDGASWRLDATIGRLVEWQHDAAWTPWSTRAVGALFALSVLAIVISSIVVVRELARQERRGSDNDLRAKQLEHQRDELLRASQGVHESLRTIARVASEPTVRETATQLDDQLGRLFDVTRVEAGEQTLRREYCDSRALVLRAMQQHQARAAERAIRLRSETGVASPVLADRERIGDVLSTLIGTALEPAPAGAEIIITTSPAERAVRFAVADVTPRILPEAFARSAREPAAFDLYTCKRLVEAHGGALGVEHADGRVHTYWFTLPDEPRLLR